MTFEEWWDDTGLDMDYDGLAKGAAMEAWEAQQVRIDQLKADVKHWQGMADGYKVQLEEKRAENKALNKGFEVFESIASKAVAENKALRELLEHVWCEGVDGYWEKNDGKQWVERLVELEIIDVKSQRQVRERGL